MFWFRVDTMHLYEIKFISYTVNDWISVFVVLVCGISHVDLKLEQHLLHD